MGLFDFLGAGKLKKEIESLQIEISHLKENNVSLEKKITELGASDYFSIQEKTKTLTKEYKDKEQQLSVDYYAKAREMNDKLKEKTEKQNLTIDNLNHKESQLNTLISNKANELAKLTKQGKTQENKLNKIKELYKAIEHSFNRYGEIEPTYNNTLLSSTQKSDLEELSPSVILKLHCMDVKDLRKAYKENDKLIAQTLEKYAARYTTKANQAIYKLMVIALRAELQNILYNLKYEKLEKSVEDIKSVAQKYLKIAGEGNQSIAGTLTKFIGEIEYLFTNAVKIEYNYYVKKEQAKQEQLALREQMRQEAEERKALEAERKKVEQEESKYNTEIQKLKEQLVTAQNSELDVLNARILELQSQLADVTIKKEEITKLANGKAGNVYIISNLGSFGDNMFKIGMTRRIDPQDRVNELGDASVPFRFDVHSFIFSDDAVGLESRLHTLLAEKRVNKVNRRKEFFYTTLDELEELVSKVEPTAEFNKTMLAEEFRQSQSTDEVYSSDALFDDIDDDIE